MKFSIFFICLSSFILNVLTQSIPLPPTGSGTTQALFCNMCPSSALSSVTLNVSSSTTPVLIQTSTVNYQQCQWLINIPLTSNSTVQLNGNSGSPRSFTGLWGNPNVNPYFNFIIAYLTPDSIVNASVAPIITTTGHLAGVNPIASNPLSTGSYRIFIMNSIVSPSNVSVYACNALVVSLATGGFGWLDVPSSTPSVWGSCSDQTVSFQNSSTGIVLATIQEPNNVAHADFAGKSVLMIITGAANDTTNYPFKILTILPNSANPTNNSNSTTNPTNHGAAISSDPIVICTTIAVLAFIIHFTTL